MEPISMVIAPLIPKLPGKPVSITASFPIWLRTNVIARNPNEVENDFWHRVKIDFLSERSVYTFKDKRCNPGIRARVNISAAKPSLTNQ
jgi:hypothetical protein